MRRLAENYVTLLSSRAEGPSRAMGRCSCSYWLSISRIPSPELGKAKFCVFGIAGFSEPIRVVNGLPSLLRNRSSEVQ